MLDTALTEQLKSVFSQIDQEVSLVYHESADPNQAELVQMLREVAATCSKITVSSSGVRAESPQFSIHSQGRKTGITFKGIPGGHEFTSLVLAILNANGKGKLPDGSVAERIKRLKGPIRLKTYVSLSCQNCPDVVQALNQMAILHSDFHHEMIDGVYAQDEIDALGIQGVPSIVRDGKLLHSGRITLLDILVKLEAEFGTAEDLSSTSEASLGKYDVVVIGGGPGGAAAAIYSARKGLKTAVVAERLGGQLQETKGIENLISTTYTEGPALSGQLRQHMAAYPLTVYEQRRASGFKVDGKSKVIHLEGGHHLLASSVIIATGAKWRELGIPGEREYLGRGVAFCPHCDGPFFKGKRVAVIGGGNSGVEAAIDLAGIVREVVLVEFQEQLKADHVLVNKLETLPNVSIVTSAKTRQIIGDEKKVIGLAYEDRKSGRVLRLDLDGVFVQIGLVPNSAFVKDVVELTKTGEIVVDGKGRTSVPGIYAAGDVTTTPYKQIVIAIGEGAKAALAAFEDRMLASGS